MPQVSKANKLLGILYDIQMLGVPINSTPIFTKIRFNTIVIRELYSKVITTPQI